MKCMLRKAMILGIALKPIMGNWSWCKTVRITTSYLFARVTTTDISGNVLMVCWLSISQYCTDKKSVIAQYLLHKSYKINHSCHNYTIKFSITVILTDYINWLQITALITVNCDIACHSVLCMYSTYKTWVDMAPSPPLYRPSCICCAFCCLD